MSDRLFRLVILISGRGSNLQAILDQVTSGQLPVDIRGVISNRPDAYGLSRARQAGIHTQALDHKDFSNRGEFDTALCQSIDQQQPDLLVLAGFMRILTPEFVEHYRGRMVNIHPSLLPKFRGLNTHERALAAGEQEHGVTVHFVTPELDGGPVIAQAKVPILARDDAETLANRVLEQEHQLYPQVIGWFIQGRVVLKGNRVLIDGQVPISEED